MSEPNYYTTKFCFSKFVRDRNAKTRIRMNKPIYSRLELSKIVIYEFWYDYIKLKHGEKRKLCYMDTDSFIVQIKIDDIYKDIAKDVEQGLALQIIS